MLRGKGGLFDAERLQSFLHMPIYILGSVAA